MSKVEILPPSRSRLPARRADDAFLPAEPPRSDTGGIVQSTLTRWEAARHARAIGAVTERTRAQAGLFDAQSQALESYVKRQRAGARVQELPEMIATDRAKRRAERADEMRQAQHQYELAENRRLAEVAHATRVLVDAQQALKAQREHGYDNYALEWKKRKCEILEVELTAAERREILRQHMGDLEQSSEPRLKPDASDDEVDEALHEARSQLRASGLDTGKIDAVLLRRNGKERS
jgi:hypothetical protein